MSDDGGERRRSGRDHSPEVSVCERAQGFLAVDTGPKLKISGQPAQRIHNRGLDMQAEVLGMRLWMIEESLNISVHAG